MRQPFTGRGGHEARILVDTMSITPPIVPFFLLWGKVSSLKQLTRTRSRSSSFGIILQDLPATPAIVVLVPARSGQAKLNQGAQSKSCLVNVLDLFFGMMSVSS